MDEMPSNPGSPWLPVDPALAAFVEDLRTMAGGPAPEPRPGLVTVMRQGASAPNTSPPGRRKMLVNTFVGSLAAKLALGVGVAAASVTAAGAAGVLPEPAQHAVAAVVGAATPFELPDSPSGVVTVTHEAPTSTTVTSTPVTPTSVRSAPVTTTTPARTGDDASTGVTQPDNHGACVSEVAKSGAGGKAVSVVARSDCGKGDGTSPSSSSTTSTTVARSTTSSTSTTVAEPNAGANRGNGNAGGGNSGRGSSGKD